MITETSLEIWEVLDNIACRRIPTEEEILLVNSWMEEKLWTETVFSYIENLIWDLKLDNAERWLSFIEPYLKFFQTETTRLHAKIDSTRFFMSSDEEETVFYKIRHIASGKFLGKSATKSARSSSELSQREIDHIINFGLNKKGRVYYSHYQAEQAFNILEKSAPGQFELVEFSLEEK